MAITVHGALVGLAYLVLLFFGLGTAGDFARFMFGSPDLKDRLGMTLVSIATTVLVIVFLWAVWMIGQPGGCS